MSDALRALNNRLAGNQASIIVTDPVTIGLVFSLSTRWQAVVFGRQLAAGAGLVAQPVIVAATDSEGFAAALYQQLYAFPSQAQRLTLAAEQVANGRYFTDDDVSVARLVALSQRYTVLLKAPNVLLFMSKAA